MTGKAKFIAGKGIKYMKKIIKGKMYNTETAEYIEHRSSGCYRSDYRYFEEDLYRKKTKEFFLHGKGGPASRYAQRAGSGYMGGEKLIPLSDAEAKVWAEENLDADRYMELFGEIEE